MKIRKKKEICFLSLPYGGLMRRKGLLSIAGIGSVVLMASFVMTSCTPKVTEEQLAQLSELRKKERSLTEEIASRRADIQKVDNELKARNAELNDCSKEKDFIKSKLSQWPNVWPDYTPAQPVPEGEQK